MANTATKNPKAPKTKTPKAPKVVEATPTAAPIEAPQDAAPAIEVKPEVKVEVPEAKVEVPEGKRKKKNTTTAVIDPAKPESFTEFLSEFLAQSEAQAPTKGYDQHVNRDGFVHAGTAQRLSNSGMANMMTLQFDILARRALDDKATSEFYDAILNFALNRREQVKADRKAKILAEAAAILAEDKAAANA